VDEPAVTAVTTSPERGNARRRKGGQGIVEFALVGPIVLLVLLGIAVCGIAVANQNLLSNGVRDAVRAAAVCGGSGRDAKTRLPAAGAVASQPCSWSQFDAYAQARLTQLAGGNALSAPTGGTNCMTLPSHSGLVCLYDSTNTAKTFTGNPLDGCQQGYKIELSAKYAQPLYLPLVGNVLGNNGSTSTRTLSADAVATCEQ
jgi:Flp pilus assembly protein TadG